MTPSFTWHASADVLAVFAVDPAGVDDATAASIETHLLVCADCRNDVARLADPALAAATWSAVADRIDAPPARALERVLLRLGVPSGPARLAAATPGLRVSGATAIIGLTAIAVLAARYVDAQGPFLVLAPLVPLVAVALTFAVATDPGGEAGVATPLHGAGLAIRRATAVLALAFVVLAAGALALPDLGSAPLGWILPAGALAVGSLAVGTWMRIELALAALAATWLANVALVRYLDGPERPFADTAPFTAAGQAVALALTVTAVIVLAVRADRYSTLEART